MNVFFEYIGFRVFEYFNSKNKTNAITNTIFFISLLQISLLVPLFIITNLFYKINPQIILISDNRIKYLIGISFTLMIIAINIIIFKKKLETEGIKILTMKYHKEKYSISVWFIFLAPVFFVFFCPILYGALNGTIHFPFLEK